MPCIINRPWPSCVKPTSGLRGPSLALASCRRTLCRPYLPLTQRRRTHVGLSCVAQQNSSVDCPAPQARTPVAMFVSYAKLLTLTGAMAAAMLLDRKPAHASTPRPQPVHNVLHTSSTSSKTKTGLWGKFKAAAGAPVGALDRLLFPDEPLEFVRYSAQANAEPSGLSTIPLQAPAASPKAAAGSSSAHLTPPQSEDTDVAAPTTAAEASDLEGPPASQAGALTAAALLPSSHQLAAAVSGATDRLASSLAHVTSALSPSWPAESVALGAISRLPGKLSAAAAAAVGPHDVTAAQAAAGVGDRGVGVVAGEGDAGAAAAVSPELARQLVRGGYALAGLVVAVMAWQLAAAVAEASKPQRAKRAPDAAPAVGAAGGAAKAPAGTSSTPATSTTVSAPAQGAADADNALPEQLRGKNVAGPFCLRPIPQQLLQQQQRQVPVIELGPTDQLPPALQGKNVVGPFCLLPQITPSLLRQQEQGPPAELQPQDLRGLTGTYKVGPLAHKATSQQPQQQQPQQASDDDASLSSVLKAPGVQGAGGRRPLWLHRPSAGPASHGHLSAAAVAAAAATAGALQAEGHSMRQAALAAAAAAAADRNSSSSSAPLQHMTAEDAAAASEGVMGAALSAAAAAAEDELEADSFEAAVQRMVLNTRPPKRFSSSSTSLQPQQGSVAAQDQAVSVELTQVVAESAGSGDKPLFRVSLKVTDAPATATAATAVSESLEGRLAARVVREALVAESCAAAAAAAAERAQITTHLIEDAIAAHSGHTFTLHKPPTGVEEAAAPSAAAGTPADSTTGGSGAASQAAVSAAEASWDEGVCCSMAAEVREAEVAAGLYDTHAAAAPAAAAPQPVTQEVSISWQSPAQTAAPAAAAAGSAAAQAIPVSWRRVESAVPAGAVVPAVAAQQVIPVVWETLASSGAAAFTPTEQEIPVSWQRSAAAAADAGPDDVITPVDSSSSLQQLVDEAKAAEAAAAEAEAARAAAAAAVARMAAVKAAAPAAAAAGGSTVDVEGLIAEACAAEAAAAEAQAARAVAAAAVARVAAAQAAGLVPPQHQSELVVSRDSTTEQPPDASASSEDEKTRIDQLVGEAKAAEAAAAEADAARAAAAAAVARVATTRSTLVKSAVKAVAAAAADASPQAVTSQSEPGQVTDSESEGHNETGPEPAGGPVGTKASAAAARSAQAELIAEAIAAEAVAFAAEAAAGAAGSAAAAEGSAGDAAEIVKGWLCSSTTGSTSSYSPATSSDSSSSVTPPLLSVSWVLSGTDESEALAQLTQLAASLGHPAIGPISSSSSADAASDADADAFKDEFGVPNDEEPVSALEGDGPAAAGAAAPPSINVLPEAAQQQQASLTAVLDAASRQQMHAASQTVLQQTQARVVALYRARRAVGAAAATNTHSTAAQQQQQGTAKLPAPSKGLTAAGALEQSSKRSSSSSGPKSLQLLSSQLGVSDVALALALASLEGSPPDSPTTTTSRGDASNTSIDATSSSAGTAASASSVSGSARVSAAGDFDDDGDVVEQVTVLGRSRDPYAEAAQAIKTRNQSSSSESAELSAVGAPEGVSVLCVSPSDEDDGWFADRFVYAETGSGHLQQLQQALAELDAQEASAAAAAAAAADSVSNKVSDSATSSTATATSSSSSTQAASDSSSPAAKQSAGSSQASATGRQHIEVVWQTLDDEEPDAFEVAVQRMLINTARPKRFTSTTSAPPAPPAAAKPAAVKPAVAADTKPAAGAASSSKRSSSSGSSVSILIQGQGSKADSFEVAVQRMVTDTHKAPTKPSADADSSSNRRSVSPSGPNKGFGKVLRLGPRPQQQQQQQRSRPSTPAVLGRVPLHKPRVFSSSSLRPLPWWEQRAAARRTQDSGLGWEGFRTPEAAATTAADAAAEPASLPAAAGSPAASAAAAPMSIPVEWMDTPTEQKRVQLKERAGAILKQQQQQQQPLGSSSSAAADAGTSGMLSKVRQLPVGWGGQGAVGEARSAAVLLPRAPKCIVQGPAAAAGPVQEIEVAFEQLASKAEELGVEVSGSGPRAAGRSGLKDLAARAGFKDLSAPYAALRGDVDVSVRGPTKTQQLLQQQKQRQGQQKQREGQQGGRGGQQQPLRQRPRGFGGQPGGRSSKAPTS